MAAHFKTDDEQNAGRTSRSSSDAGAQRISTPRHAASDESYHAPASNPHAAAHINTTVDQGFVSVVSEPEDSKRRKKRNKRRKDREFVQTDPYDISGKRSRDPKKRRARIISTLLFIVGVALVVVAAGMFASDQQEYAEQEEVNDTLASYAVVDSDGSTSPSIDWDSLKAVNADVVGWIQIPGTVINYPVYQGVDNDEYLRTNAWGEYSVGGQIFMDYENTAPGLTDGQTIIYGHHLNNGSMFAALADLENDQDAFDSITTVWYVTEEAAYELQPILAYHAEADDTNVRTLNFSSTEELQSYLTDLLAVSTTSADDAEELIASSEHVLTLCTCSYTQEEKGRMVLVCAIKDVTYYDTSDDAGDADASTDAETSDAATTDDSTE